MNDTRTMVLLVEDDICVSFALTRRLQSAGYRVIAAPDGLTATMAAQAQCVDVALIDINLPLKDGFEVAEEIMARTCAKVLFMTASRDAHMRRRARALGALGFIEKPFTSSYLLMQIANALAPSEPASRDG